MFRIPQKQLIVNSSAQLRILKYDGSATYIDIVSPVLTGSSNSSGFFLEGFLGPTLFGSMKAVVGSTLLLAVAGAAGNKQVATFIPDNGTLGDASSFNFVILYQALKLSPTEYQNQPLMKHYQLSATLGTNPANTVIATAIGNAISADKNSPVTLTSVAGSTVTLTAKEVGVTFSLIPATAFRGGTVTGTFAVTTPASNDIGTYDDLKNLNWAKGDQYGHYDVDRNAEYFPVFGQTYKSYRFILKSTPLMSTNLLVPSEAAAANSIQTEFRIWIANGLTLQTTMDLVVADANSAV